MEGNNLLNDKSFIELAIAKATMKTGAKIFCLFLSSALS